MAQLCLLFTQVVPAGFDNFAFFAAKDGSSLKHPGSIGWCVEIKGADGPQLGLQRTRSSFAEGGMLHEDMGVGTWADLEAPTAEALGDCEALRCGIHSEKEVIVVYTDDLLPFKWHCCSSVSEGKGRIKGIYKRALPSSWAYRKARSYRDELIYHAVVELPA